VIGLKKYLGNCLQPDVSCPWQVLGIRKKNKEPWFLVEKIGEKNIGIVDQVILVEIFCRYQKGCYIKKNPCD